VPKLDAGLWLGVSLAGLGGSSVLVDHGDVGSGRFRGIAVAGSWVGGCWSRLSRGRWSVKVANVAVEDAAGVSFVVDQHPVGALGADAADEPFRVAVRLGVRRGMFTTSMPSEANTAGSKRRSWDVVPHAAITRSLAFQDQPTTACLASRSTLSRDHLLAGTTTLGTGIFTSPDRELFGS
jgi:hypothetical protein